MAHNHSNAFDVLIVGSSLAGLTVALHLAPALCKKITAIDGVGPITATAIVAAVGDGTEFKNGRHLAAWLGLVPRQYSSGGKSRLKDISKRGDAYLRTLLIRGARSVLRYAVGKVDARSRWLQEMVARRGYNRAAVATSGSGRGAPARCGMVTVSMVFVPCVSGSGKWRAASFGIEQSLIQQLLNRPTHRPI